jgi:energy-converting hydrogenase Eha subunit A
LPSCTLEIGGRIVARAEGGPFDAEYALFEAHEIELRSNNEPGTVREHGYSTTAELARERLEMEGVTRALADAVAGELGALATAYALGPEVRRVVALLTPSELFEGRVWQPAAKQYEGAWLDVAALAADSGVDGAARALQELYLATLLAEVPPESAVYLTTTDYTAGRRPGERTYRRVSLATVGAMPDAIRALANRQPARSLREGGPSRAELLENVRARLSSGVLESSRVALEAIERALSVRDRPQRGPLADPDLWALELLLADGRGDGNASDKLNAKVAIEKIDALERARGRQPGTTYLRARAALLLGSEEPQQLAERVSALAMSMNAFAELELLAAEAWALAGDRKRALAYAHNLAEDPQVDPAIRARARAIESPTRESAPPVARPPSIVPPFTPVPPPESRPPRSESSPMVAITAGLRGSTAPARTLGDSRRPGAPSTPPLPAESAWDESAIAPTPIVSIGVEALRRSSAPARETSDALAAAAPSSVSSSAILASQRASQSSMRAPAPPGSSAPSASRYPATTPMPVPDLEVRAPARSDRAAPIPELRPSLRVSREEDLDDEEENDGSEVVVRGGSQPPFRTEPPPPNFPPVPLLPRLDGERVQKAETLSLPAGLTDEGAGDDLPTTPLEARIYFTRRTRELGARYRERYNVELRTDLRSVELVQRYLVEQFQTGELRTPEDIHEVRLHGAFVSELLARRLGAEWTDIAVSEMGYWAMNVPPGTTVWPLGRVIRFVTMQHRERDLVSYFLELQARAHGLK